MGRITTLVWDVGGVLLTNGWDHEERAEVAAEFGLDLADLNRRHEAVFDSYEKGRTTLTSYLHDTVFYTPRPFTEEAFRAAIERRSRPHPDVIDLARQYSRTKRYRMAVLNNEGQEFNEYRIGPFGLAEIFSVFFSSCYTGLRKPDPLAYRQVVQMLQDRPSSCVFIDDREENLVPARQLGMRTIQFRGVSGLQTELAQMGVEPDPGGPS
jgi:putative hydrolase of the HAD superfamily